MGTSHHHADVVLRDGSTAHIRQIGPGDEASLAALLDGLSIESLALRFFSGAVDTGKAAHHMVNDRGAFGLIATTGPEHLVAGHASFIPIGDDRAEVALVVADAAQGHGIGTLLLGQLAQAASERHVTVFEGRVLPRNHRMLAMVRASGFPIRTRSEPGEIVFEFPTSISGEAAERFAARERTGAVAAMRRFLSPRAVAVIGASRTRGTIGAEVFHNLIASGFNGPVYPVNPKADHVQSIAAYASIADVPGPVDLAVIVVPGPAVAGVARACAEVGVPSIVVISAGFAEVGGDGAERQRELLAICRDTGMRLIGPNCMGIVNTAPDVRLEATFAPIAPPHGRVGFSSQSGALGLAVIDHAASLGLGISSFVSVGNKADISGNDLLHYWEADDDTDVILLYLESFGNPRTFARIARRISRRKPIIAVKGGRSPAGARATSSHTGAMLAANDVTVDALFQQAGVIRTETLAEMFDVASLLANQPPPRGDRVAIITNAGGPGILCADACVAAGLTVAGFPSDVRAALAAFLPAEAATQDPVDMIASANGDAYRRAIEVVAACEDVDAIVVIFIPPLVTRTDEVAEAIRDAATHLPRPVPLLSVFMSSHGVPAALRDAHVRIPSYAFPEDAARALARAVAYGRWRARPEGTTPSFEVRTDEASSIIATALADGHGWLGPEQVWALLDAYGIPLVEQRVVRSARAAAAAAAALGGGLALKAIAPGLLHKTEAGAVLLNLTPGRTAQAASQMASTLRAAGHRPDAFAVQRMAPRGVEAFVGVVTDPSFGPVVACGAGGTAVELLNDVAIRIAPLTTDDADEMIRSLRTFPLFDGYRGAPVADVAALREVVLRVSALVDAHPEIAEMDLNPVIVLQAGALVVDARIRLGDPGPATRLSARRR